MVEKAAPDYTRWLLGATLVLYLLLSIGYNRSIRLDNAPDEPRHYTYIASLARGHGMPRHRPDNEPVPPRPTPEVAEARAWDVPPTQAAFHPPFYYAAAALFERLVQPILGKGTPHVNLATADSPEPSAHSSARIEHAVRFLSTLFGLVTLVLVYRLALLLAPGNRFVPVVAPALVAFTPLFTYMSAAINNDVLLVMFTTLLLYQMVLFLKTGSGRHMAAAGVTLGLAMLTKEAALSSIGALALAILWQARRSGNWARAARNAAVAGAGLLVLWGWWPIYHRTMEHGYILPVASTGQGELFAHMLAEPRFAVEVLFTIVACSLSSILTPQWVVAPFVEMGPYRVAVLFGLCLMAVGMALSWRAGDWREPWKKAFLLACCVGLCLLTLGILHFIIFIDSHALVAGRYFLPGISTMALFAAFGWNALLRLRSERRQWIAALIVWVALAAVAAWGLQMTHVFYTQGYWQG